MRFRQGSFVWTSRRECTKLARRLFGGIPPPSPYPRTATPTFDSRLCLASLHTISCRRKWMILSAPPHFTTCAWLSDKIETLFPELIEDLTQVEQFVPNAPRGCSRHCFATKPICHPHSQAL